jgi:hypothetical protein
MLSTAKSIELTHLSHLDSRIDTISGDVHYQAAITVDYRYTYKDGRSS